MNSMSFGSVSNKGGNPSQTPFSTERLEQNSEAERAGFVQEIDWSMFRPQSLRIDEGIKRNLLDWSWSFEKEGPYDESHLTSSSVNNYRNLLLEFYMTEVPLSERIFRCMNYLIQHLTPQELALQNASGRTSLHLAIEKKLERQIISIIEKMDGNDLCRQDSKGKTILHYASEKSIGRSILALLEKMPDEAIEKKDVMGKTFMHSFSFKEAQLEDFRRILEKTAPKILGMEDSQGYLPLHYLIEGGRFSEWKIFIELLGKKMLSEDLNKNFAKWGNFLHFSVQRKKVESDVIAVLVYIMQEEATNTKNHEGNTPLEQFNIHRKTCDPERARGLAWALEVDDSGCCCCDYAEDRLRKLLASYDPMDLSP